jgi:hypothetical protein
MKRSQLLRNTGLHTGTLALAVILMTGYSCNRTKTISPQEYTRIQEGFTTPQDTNRLWCYYYWIGDDISREGVTKDLEAMKEFGIGAVLMGNINPDEVDGRVPLFSDEWWETTIHAVNEGKRVGIDVGMFNSPGWSQSGGPWITHDKAMRHVVYSETKVSGPARIRIQLTKPAEEFQDICVLGFRCIDAEGKRLTRSNASIRLSPAVLDAEKWIDGAPRTSAVFNIGDRAEYTIDITAREPIEARSIRIYPAEQPFLCDIELMARVNGEYIPVKSFTFDRSNPREAVGPVTHGPVAIAFPPVTSDAFRLVCKNLVSSAPRAGFSEIVISEGAVLEKYVEKTLGKMHPTPFPRFDSYMWDLQEAIDDPSLVLSEVHDISDQMDENGFLEGDAPEGEWTILRVGMTPTGTKNSPAAPQGKGYEVDKASRELARFHFEQYIQKIQERIPQENRPAFKYVIADSYETGSQNWTDGFARRFQEKYGYSPITYLPVFSGRIVHSAEESERFLWDLRRMVADDIAYGYVGGLREVSNEHNLQLWLENYGHWGYPGEFLMYGGQTNLVGGEFWNEGTLGDIECKSASSAAHVYGKPRISAEAFTASGMSYMRHPALLKKRGDWCFTEGINHFVLHLYIHQPNDDRIPGINAWFSTEFNRHNTWFKQGKNWADYIRRCQHMQQQGKYSAEVCYFIGEDAPKMTGTRDPELPAGYSYDYINAEVILQRLSVENGKFLLPDGMTYDLMVLPDLKTMRPEVLTRIEELVRLGGNILGPRPEKSPSLQGFPQCDLAVQELAETLWPDLYQDGVLKNAHGEGYVLDGMGIQEALDFIDVPKDIDFDKNLPVLWTHRTMPGMEIYFITNQGDEEVDFSPSFRVKGMKPQLWDAVTGKIRMLADYSEEDGRTSVPLKMKAHESWVLVFTNAANEQTAPAYDANFPDMKTIRVLEDEWLVDFVNKDIGPAEPRTFPRLINWTESGDQAIKYYSGSALYRTSFTMDEIPQGDELYIDLGEVNVMARVSLNGSDLGGVWMAPFRVDTKGLLKAGENTLEVEVVNVWRNRLIRDKQLPLALRYTSVLVSDETADEPLQPSGLVGPVTIQKMDNMEAVRRGLQKSKRSEQF